MRAKLRRFLWCSLYALGALVVASCGDTSGKIPETGASLEGTVMYNNEPVQFALVIAVTQGASSTGKIEEGKYKINNIPVGEVKLAVNTDAGKGDFMTATMSGVYKGPEVKGGGGKRVPMKYLEVPKKYHDPETSGIKTTIVKGANTYDIKIDGK